MKKIAIFGAGGFGREVKWLIDDINKKEKRWDFIGYFDDNFSGNKIDKKFFLGTAADLNNWKEELNVVFAIGDPLVKRKIIQSVNNLKLSFPKLIHPSCICGIGEENIGEGAIICAGNIITVDINIGKHVILNLSCTVGHDSIIGDYSSFMPTVNISGEVTTGVAVYIGTGVKIINRVEIGEETIVGAGAVVVRSLPAYCTAVGTPAKAVRFHKTVS